MTKYLFTCAEGIRCEAPAASRLQRTTNAIRRSECEDKHRELASPLRALTDRLGREINPHFFTREEIDKRLAARDHFLRDVMAKPKLFIVGDEHEFTDLAGRWIAM